MLHVSRLGLTMGAVMAAVMIASGNPFAQSKVTPTNDLPNPYRTVEGWAKLPAGRTWGSTSAVDVDKDGRSIWVGERCGANSCLDRTTNEIQNLPTVLKFDSNGNLVTGFGQGMLIFPHGIHVDRDGNVWVTDGQDDAPVPARGAPQAPGTAPAPRLGPLPGATRGHQVYKFSPDGKLLMTLGKAGGAAEPGFFYQPNDVYVVPSGEIFVGEGHGGANSRILKFSKDGKLIKVIVKKGPGPGEFDQPHSIAMDSQGRLFIGDRGNNRVQIISQDGAFIAEWPQFGRPSGVYIDKNDNHYVADSESGSVNANRTEWRRGIRIGSAKDGKVTAFIPDPETRNAPEFRGTSAAEGVVVDSAGNIYGAEVGPKALKRYVKK
jgi:sugar lactone lactonase YvrE